MGGRKYIKMVQVTWPISPPCPYTVKTLKNLLLWNQKPMTLKVGMQHWVLEYYQVCSNDDPGWPWSIFRGQPRAFRQGEVLRHFQDVREKFWSKFWISLYVLYIFTSPSAQNREKSASLGRLFLPDRPLGWALILWQGQLWSLMLLYGKKVKTKFSTWTFMNIKGQGHSLTFVQGHSDSTFSNFFSSKNTRPIETKFHIEPPRDSGMKTCSNVLGHTTKMASRPIYGKNLQKSPSSKPRVRWLETWYTTSGTQALPNLFKWWHWVDHDLFYDMVKFVL